jgi:hypothetical protein
VKAVWQASLQFFVLNLRVPVAGTPVGVGNGDETNHLWQEISVKDSARKSSTGVLIHPACHRKGDQPEEALCRTGHSAACQVESSWLCFSIFGASVSVLGPKSFSWTTPSWVTMKVMTPDDS